MSFYERNSVRIALIICFILIVFYVCTTPFFFEKITKIFAIIKDKKQFNDYIVSFGTKAPVAFILIQIFQVLFAPVPGEATGFIGGYIFGAFKGFLYSSIGLSVGSCINFLVGRFLGKRFVKKIIPDRYLDSLDKIAKRQGVIVIAFCFIFPGFPKDYFCLFLGLSSLPFKMFIILASIGRMPGTFLLSLQGACLYDKMYTLVAVLFLFFFILAVAVYKYRENIYKLIEKNDANE